MGLVGSALEDGANRSSWEFLRIFEWNPKAFFILSIPSLLIAFIVLAIIWKRTQELSVMQGLKFLLKRMFLFLCAISLIFVGSVVLSNI